jgi:hypothetical protein
MRAFTGAVLVFWGGAALAEPLNLHSNEYKPLVNTKAGKVDMCGVHFSSVVTTLKGIPLNIQGSVNATYYEGRVPAMIIKVSATGIGPDKRPYSPKIYGATMRVSQRDTRPMQAQPGEDGASILLMTDLTKEPDLVMEFPTSFITGAWLSLTLDRNMGDFTYQLPEFGDKGMKSTFVEFNQCNQIGLDNVMKMLKPQ